MIEGKVIGADTVIRKLAGFEVSLRATVRRVVETFAIRVEARTKEKLSDDVLHVRTGRLRRSIHHQITDQPSEISAAVGTNVEYARTLEFGFHGPVNVRAFMRMQVVAFGRTMMNPHMVSVRAHTRNVNIPERSFLRAALREVIPGFPQELEAAAGEQVRAFNR